MKIRFTEFGLCSRHSDALTVDHGKVPEAARLRSGIVGKVIPGTYKIEAHLVGWRQLVVDLTLDIVEGKVGAWIRVDVLEHILEIALPDSKNPGSLLRRRAFAENGEVDQAEARLSNDLLGVSRAVVNREHRAERIPMFCGEASADEIDLFHHLDVEDADARERFCFEMVRFIDAHTVHEDKIFIRGAAADIEPRACFVVHADTRQRLQRAQNVFCHSGDMDNLVALELRKTDGSVCFRRRPRVDTDFLEKVCDRRKAYGDRRIRPLDENRLRLVAEMGDDERR